MDLLLRALINWRTTLPAVVLCIVLAFFLLGKITVEAALGCVTILTAAGLFRSKDDKVTGGSVENHSDPDKVIR